MVVKMMKWRPWPPPSMRKYAVKLILKRIQGVAIEETGQEGSRFMVEVKWKGQKPAFTTLRRKMIRNFTAERTSSRENAQDGGHGLTVEWEEEFSNICNLSAYKENCFHPWEISLIVLHVLDHGTKKKVSVIGAVTVNLAEFVRGKEQKEIELNIPISLYGSSLETQPTLTLCFKLLDLTTQESACPIPRSPSPLSPSNDEVSLSEKGELSALKASLMKVKILTDYMSARRTKKSCRGDESSDGKYSGPSDEAECAYPFDDDSLVDMDDGVDSDNELSSFRKSFTYGTLASTNYIGRSHYPTTRIDGGDEEWIYYSNRRSDAGSTHAEESTSMYPEPSTSQTSKLSILSWKKRKISFRSPKTKGEPLLKKSYAEDGGDDIDFDRRQLSSSDESFGLEGYKGVECAAPNPFSVSDFGDDNFAVGCWERKEVISRDGHMKLCADVFFATIDQRSERAAGESACTALVAVIADWFGHNRDSMPIKSQFDSLIRDGSLEWRNLCENDGYMQRFPDKHFELDTVLEAKIRPLSVIPGKSFIGFFLPDGMDDGLQFLQGAMSFESIWDEISKAMSAPASEPHVYIVSWNDHFFILKVELDSYYIVDTLGERLFEGCNQAYILKFDRDTSIFRLQDEAQAKQDKQSSDPQSAEGGEREKEKRRAEENTIVTKKVDATDKRQDEELVCRGKESCKEYIRRFLAAIPLRDLQVDVKKGLMTSPLHHRLQIEFHYTAPLAPPSSDLDAAPVAI